MALAAMAWPLATSAGDTPLPSPITHERFNGLDPLTSAGDGATSSGSSSGSALLCNAAGTDGTNVRVDCENQGPHNETSIAVNPTNPKNLIGGANDYQLILSSGGILKETIISHAHVSFDGGQTWAAYSVPVNSYTGTGDPAVAFDATGRAYYGTLGFGFGQKSPTGTNADIIVSTSIDGGKTWTMPQRVAASSGALNSPGVFNDKDYLTAWGNGNAIVTWSRFLDGKGGSYIQSPIFASVTHDGGQTWSAGVEISGNASFCTGSGQEAANACDQDQVSIPVVDKSGAIFVAFENGPAPGSPDFDDQYLVVQVDPQTGAPIAGPFQAAVLQDGTADYPINIDGRQTYQDSEFRTWSAGNIAADPTTAGHLAITFSDMRNSPSLDSGSTDPFTTKTNSDVFAIQSFDGGHSWSAPVQVGPEKNDQFFPWAAYRPDGRLAISIMDRSYDRKNHMYGITLSTESSDGSFSFSSQQVTTALSDPTSGDRWFSGSSPNHATTFLGDYNAVAYDPSATAHPLWTDMRNSVCFTVRCGHDEQLWTASVQ
jgi:hypothetical protein